MPPQLVVIVIVVSLNGCLFDHTIHSLGVIVGPGMIDLGEAMLNAVFLASHAKHMR
jgi:hypothetical protein